MNDALGERLLDEVRRLANAAERTADLTQDILDYRERIDSLNLARAVVADEIKVEAARAMIAKWDADRDETR